MYPYQTHTQVKPQVQTVTKGVADQINIQKRICLDSHLKDARLYAVYKLQKTII